MANTPERRVKQQVVKQLRAMDAYLFFPATGGFGVSGVPDIIACYKGYFIGVECKAGKNKPTRLQQRNLDLISAAGGLSMVVNEENMEGVADKIKKHLD